MNGFHTFAKQLHLLQENASKYDWIDLNVWDSSDIVFSVEGPVGTPYEGGIYRVRFDNLEYFPKVPPTVFFLTKIWHPLVEYSTGRICPDSFKDGWTPEEGLEGFLHRLQLLFFLQKMDTAINFEAMAEIERKDGTFERHAVLLTKKYATE